MPTTGVFPRYPIVTPLNRQGHRGLLNPPNQIPSNQKSPYLPRPQVRKLRLWASDTPKVTQQEGTPWGFKSAPA